MTPSAGFPATAVLPSGQVGTAAARPAASSVPAGFLYYATDTNALSESNGSVWTTVVSGGGGGLSSVPAAFGAGSANGTDYTSAAAAFADIDAVNLNVSVAAGVGDLLLVTFQGSVFNTTATNRTFMRAILTSSATVSPTTGGTTSNGGGVLPAAMTWGHTVVAGDLAAGSVAVKLQFSNADAGGTSHVQNSATSFPTMAVLNLKH